MSQGQEIQAEVPPDLQALVEVHQLLLQQVTEGIFITNQEGHLLEANLAGCQLLDYTHKELTNLSWQDLLAQETSTHDPLSPDNISIGQKVSAERQLRRKDNRLILTSITGHKLSNDNTLWIVRDLSAAQPVGETLQERLAWDEQLAKIVATAPGVLCLFQLQPDGTATCPYASPAIQDIYGLAPEELAKDASPVLELIHPDDVARVQESIAESARTLLPWQDEYRIQHPVKGEIWVEGHSTPARKPDGTILWYGFLQDITERKKAEEVLRVHQARMTGIIESAMDAIISIDEDQRIILFNAAAEQMFGNSAAEAIGQSLNRFIPERFRQAHRQHIQAFGETGVTNRGMGTLGVIFGRRFNGEEFPIEASISQIEAAGAKLFTVILRDVTERQQVEEALRTNQARMTGIIESAMDAIISVDEDQRIILFNAAAEQMFGCLAAEAIGQPVDQFIPERFRQAHRQHIQTFGETGVTNRGMGTLGVIFGRRLNGEEFPIEASISQIEAAGAKLFTVILRDVTERQQAEEALRRSEARFRNYFELGLVGQAITSPSKGFLEFNDQMCAILGYDRQELLHMSWAELTHPDDLAQDMAHFNRIMAGEIDGYSLEKRFIRKDRQIVHSTISVKCVRNIDGSVDYIVALVLDVTQRKKAEEQLLYQANLLQNVSDAIIATDMQFKITSWNQAAVIIYGWTAEEALGQGVNELLETEYVDDETDHVLQQFLEEGIWQGEVMQKHKNGSMLNILASVSMIKDSRGNMTGTVAANRDITERKEAEKAHALLEAQLQQSQKMESMGQLAGGVAHDFNNMLTVIQMYSELIRAKLPANDPLIEKIELIRGASQRSAALTRQLLAFSRQQVMAPKIIDLNSLVTDLLKMVERLIGEDIILSSVLQPGLWPITADPGQIEQVIMNLVVNARDAMPVGGMLTIETRNIQLDEAYVRTHLEATPGPFVVLTVSDMGEGMDKQTQSRIFEPFFTTKEHGKGTGLGLATVYGIVKQSGGNILVYSEPGKGTTFKVYLPANKETSELEETQTQTMSLGGSETILLVEDEDMVRELVHGTLQDLGYTVLVAHRGDAALSLVQAYPNQIDLLLSDVVMPRMSGRELAEGLQEQRPQMKVLFMSGYTDDAVIRHGLLMAEVEFLHKPFSPAELAAKVRHVLDKNVDLQ